jgi:hypothetical protein
MDDDVIKRLQLARLELDMAKECYIFYPTQANLWKIIRLKTQFEGLQWKSKSRRAMHKMLINQVY